MRPEIAADTAAGALPDPAMGVHGAVDPYALVGPYSNSHFVTSPPMGFTVAFNVAEVCVTAVAGFFSTAGGWVGSANGVRAPASALNTDAMLA